jgi:hypothetical protein
LKEYNEKQYSPQVKIQMIHFNNPLSPEKNYLKGQLLTSPITYIVIKTNLLKDIILIGV